MHGNNSYVHVCSKLHTMQTKHQEALNRLNANQVLALFSVFVATLEWADMNNTVAEYIDSTDLSIADAYELIDIICGPGYGASRLQSMLVR